MYPVYVSEETSINVQYNIKWQVIITAMKSVYCTVRTGPLNKTVYVSFLKDYAIAWSEVSWKCVV